MNKNENEQLTKTLKSLTDTLFDLFKSVPDEKKEKYSEPEKRLEKRKKEASHREELEKQEIEDRKSNRELREKYANKMFRYMCIWSVVVFLILICSGFQWCYFQLDKWVLVTLIGSTTVSVFAIVRAIIEGLFKNKT